MLFLSCMVDARPSFCAATPDTHYLLMQYSQHDAAAVTTLPPGSVDKRRFQWEALLLGDSGSEQTLPKATQPPSHWLAGLGHEYTTVEFDQLPPPEPQSNGDLHTLYAPVHWQVPGPRRHNRFSLAPAISTSSNALKHPDTLNGDALQLWLAFEQSRQISARLQLLLGLCADHRFGHFQGYPVLGLLWQPTAQWTLRLAYPDTSIRYGLAPRWSLSLAISPDGNEWQVLDRERQNRSRFSRQAWRAEWLLSWQMTQSLTLTAAVGRSLEQQLHFARNNHRTLQADLDNSSYGRLELRWTFLQRP